jgi:hypothetical protein
MASSGGSRAASNMGSENISALKRFLADPDKIAAAKRGIRRNDAAPLDIEPMEEVVPRKDNFTPWALLKQQENARLAAAARAARVARARAKAKASAGTGAPAESESAHQEAPLDLKGLSHPLAHISDPRRLEAAHLWNLSPAQWEFVGNATEMCDTARALAGERARLVMKRDRGIARQEQRNTPKVKNLTHYVRREVLSLRSERMVSSGGTTDPAQRCLQTRHFSPASGKEAFSTGSSPRKPALPLSARGTGRDAYLSEGSTRKQMPAPSAHSPVDSELLRGTPRSSHRDHEVSTPQSAREAGTGVLILTPRGTRRRLWTPRSHRTLQTEKDSSTSRGFFFSSSNIATHRATPRVLSTPRSGRGSYRTREMPSPNMAQSIARV